MKSFFITFIVFVAACASKGSRDVNVADSNSQDSSRYSYTLSQAEWKFKLTEQEFYVLRQKGTERAFTGKYWDRKEKGTYTCAGCAQPLFHSSTKFKSGTGWPSFYEPISEDAINEIVDRSLGMVRTEVVCSRCGGHQGHVFPDGPEPTGLRYCVNSVSLDFKPD